MPKVLRIINRFNLGGITYNVSYLSRFLPQHYETLLIGGPEEQGEESSLFIPESMQLQPQIVHEMKRSINPFADYKAYRKIKKIIKSYQPDIVHTHASKAGAIGRLAAAHCKVPVIVHTFHGHVFHGYFSPVKTKFFKLLERFLAKKSNAIVAISDIQQHELCEIHKICPQHKTHVIPLGFDLKRFTEKISEKRLSFRSKYQVSETEIAIGIIGRLAPIKDHLLFVDAVAHVLKNTELKIKAFIIGDGETRTMITNYVQEKQIAQHFIFTSWIKEVDWALAGLDLVALSSKNEGTPVSLIEAQAAGKFIVSTNVGGIKDILHPDCGLLSEKEDKEGFKNNLLLAVNNLQSLSKKAGVASELVIKRFSYERLCSDMDHLYTQLLAERS
jgi:glycosyltransferase involved in cell wall biosynthesis